MKWFQEIDDNVKISIAQVDDLLGQLMQLQPYTEHIEHGRGQEMEVKVVEKQEVDQILRASGSSNQKETMQFVIDRLEFFRVECNSSRAGSVSTNQADLYDYEKLILFCILFCGDERQDYARRVEHLFFLMCDGSSQMISQRSENTKKYIALMTIIACMIPAEIIKIDRLRKANQQDRNEFDRLYNQYCCQPNQFHKFTSYLKFSKLFAGVKGAIDLRQFQEMMQDQEYFLLRSEMIRYEYTYFVCMAEWPEHTSYFSRKSIVASEYSRQHSDVLSSRSSYVSKREMDRAAAESYNDSVNLSQQSASQLMHDDMYGDGSKTKTTAKKNLKKGKTKVKISAIDSFRDSIDLNSLPSAKHKQILSGN